MTPGRSLGVAARRVSGTLRSRAPSRLVGLLRRLVHAVGLLTARWRLEPAFLVVGAQRAGTTTLYRILSDHPQVVRPTQSKGIGYFDLEHARGHRWYRAHFPIAALARRRVHGTPVTFESRGYYLLHPLAPERIAREMPHVKVVVVVRDPVERAHSAHKHERARGFEDLDFADAIEREPERLAGETDRIRTDPTYESYALQHHAYLTRSRYSEQIRRYVELLGPDRVHVVDAGHLFADAGPELELLEDFLGLQRWRPASVERWNARPSAPLDPALVCRLAEHFAPYDTELTTQMGRAPSWQPRETAARRSS